MQFINKTTPSEEFDEMRKVILDSISGNISSIAQLGKHGAINEADTTKMGYYVIKCLYKPYTLKKDQTTDGQVSREGGLSVKSDYLIIRKTKTNWYWQHHRTNQISAISIRIISHPCL